MKRERGVISTMTIISLALRSIMPANALKMGYYCYYYCLVAVLALTTTVTTAAFIRTPVATTEITGSLPGQRRVLPARHSLPTASVGHQNTHRRSLIAAASIDRSAPVVLASWSLNKRTLVLHADVDVPVYLGDPSQPWDHTFVTGYPRYPSQDFSFQCSSLQQPYDPPTQTLPSQHEFLEALRLSDQLDDWPRSADRQDAFHPLNPNGIVKRVHRVPPPEGERDSLPSGVVYARFSLEVPLSMAVRECQQTGIGFDSTASQNMYSIPLSYLSRNKYGGQVSHTATFEIVIAKKKHVVMCGGTQQHRIKAYLKNLNATQSGCSQSGGGDHRRLLVQYHVEYHHDQIQGTPGFLGVGSTGRGRRLLGKGKSKGKGHGKKDSHEDDDEDDDDHVYPCRWIHDNRANQQAHNKWCSDNCLSFTPYCPPDKCVCDSDPPSPQNSPTPTPMSMPTPTPTPPTPTPMAIPTPTPTPTTPTPTHQPGPRPDTFAYMGPLTARDIRPLLGNCYDLAITDLVAHGCQPGVCHFTVYTETHCRAIVESGDAFRVCLSGQTGYPTPDLAQRFDMRVKPYQCPQSAITFQGGAVAVDTHACHPATTGRDDTDHIQITLDVPIFPARKAELDLDVGGALLRNKDDTLETIASTDSDTDALVLHHEGDVTPVVFLDSELLRETYQLFIVDANITAIGANQTAWGAAGNSVVLYQDQWRARATIVPKAMVTGPGGSQAQGMSVQACYGVAGCDGFSVPVQDLLDLLPARIEKELQLFRIDLLCEYDLPSMAVHGHGGRGRRLLQTTIPAPAKTQQGSTQVKFVVQSPPGGGINPPLPDDPTGCTLQPADTVLEDDYNDALYLAFILVSTLFLLLILCHHLDDAKRIQCQCKDS